MVAYSTAALGFGRMGPNREVKFALEKYWKSAITADDLLAVAGSTEKEAWDLQTEAGIDRVSVGDFDLYDCVATWADNLGIVPRRFKHLEHGIDRMFATCRGIDGAEALSMKKWITSNYHYMVPEVDESLIELSPNFSRYLADVKRGVDYLGAARATPVVLGPVTMTHLCVYKMYACEPVSTTPKKIFSNQFEIGLDAEVAGNAESLGIQRASLLEKLLPIYRTLMTDLVDLGVKEIQIHEPSLVFDEAALAPLFKRTYEGSHSILPVNVDINMVSFCEDVGETNYRWLVSVPGINTISLDFTRGENLKLIQDFGFPAAKVLGAGLIDGRNVWKINPTVVDDTLKALGAASVKSVRVQPSCSLMFVPWNLECEDSLLSSPAGPVLAFSKQKLSEVVAVAKNDTAFLKDASVKWSAYINTLAADKTISNRVAALTEADFNRSEVFKERRKHQLLGIPLLPTTTIGSFPQTREIRSLRNQLKRNKITKEEYENKINQQIALMIGIQEALGLDILVHGEPERTDMVEYFGVQMDGMLFSQNGWVQSFGSRCVRPPIFWSDISRPAAMTIREYKVAQALTKKPVKGMLTGPVTILNWSFPRIDISRKEQAMQIALGLRDEVADLEAAGCKVIQVDEPALREAMPLRPASRDEYLTWTVDSFKLATSGPSPSVQIHTHMCYCEFEDCMEAIDRMDTDVISIENARSDDATLLAFRDIGYGKGLGPGTYDIHSPVVPPVSFIEDKIRMFLASGVSKENLVINPDCGLKTRSWPETIGQLKAMIEATNTIRAEIFPPEEEKKEDYEPQAPHLHPHIY